MFFKIIMRTLFLLQLSSLFLLTSCDFKNLPSFFCSLFSGQSCVKNKALPAELERFQGNPVGEDTFSFEIKLLIEGLYLPSSQKMSAFFYNLGKSHNETVADSITIEFWDPQNPHALIYSLEDIDLDVDGVARLELPMTLKGEAYYLAIKHRNSFQTWSAAAVDLSENGIYDFTSSIEQAFSNGSNPPMKQLSDGKFALYSGDVDQDGVIDLSDLNSIASQSSYDEDLDLNGDEVVDNADQNIAYSNSLGSKAAVTKLDVFPSH